MSYLPELKSSLVRAARRQHEIALPDSREHGELAPRRRRARTWLGAAPALLALAVTVAIAGGALIVIRPGHSTPATSASGKKAPPSLTAVTRGARPLAPAAQIALPILGSAGTRRLDDYRGEVVVLNLFASWCLPCKVEMSALEQAQRRIARHGATVLGVTYLDNLTASKAFVRAAHITYPVLRDVSGRFVLAFGSTGVPETFVIDRNGRIAAVRRFQVDNRWLAQTLPKLLAEPNAISPGATPGDLTAAFPVLRRPRTPADALPVSLAHVDHGAAFDSRSRLVLSTPKIRMWIVPGRQTSCLVTIGGGGGCTPNRVAEVRGSRASRGDPQGPERYSTAISARLLTPIGARAAWLDRLCRVGAQAAPAAPAMSQAAARWCR